VKSCVKPQFEASWLPELLRLWTILIQNPRTGLIDSEVLSVQWGASLRTMCVVELECCWRCWVPWDPVTRSRGDVGGF